MSGTETDTIVGTLIVPQEEVEAAERFLKWASEDKHTGGPLRIRLPLDEQPVVKRGGWWMWQGKNRGPEQTKAVILAHIWKQHGNEGEPRTGRVELCRPKTYGDGDNLWKMRCKCGRWADPDDDSHGCIWTPFTHLGTYTLVAWGVEREQVNIGVLDDDYEFVPWVEIGI
jgi:hypothetical protein